MKICFEKADGSGVALMDAFALDRTTRLYDGKPPVFHIYNGVVDVYIDPHERQQIVGLMNDAGYRPANKESTPG